MARASMNLDSRKNAEFLSALFRSVGQTATSVPSALKRSNWFGSHNFFIVVALDVPCIAGDDGLNLSYRPCCALGSGEKQVILGFCSAYQVSMCEFALGPTARVVKVVVQRFTGALILVKVITARRTSLCR